MIKQYWESKSAKDRNYLIALGIFLIICLFYFIIWLPLHNTKNDLLSQINDQKELIQWMQEKAPLLSQKSSNNAIEKPKEIFSIIEKSFKSQENLFPKLVISRNAENRVTVTFNNVPFDAFIKQLILLKNKYQIDIEEAQITKLEQAGFVEGRVVLESH